MTRLVGFTLLMMSPTKHSGPGPGVHVPGAAAPAGRDSSRPAPIDPRGPRFNQGVLTVGLLVAFVANVWPVVTVFMLVLAAGAAGGPRWAPMIRVYQQWIKPRLGPPDELEDPRPPRFAAAVGVVFLAAATLAFLAGATTLGWVLTLIVAGLAALAAATGVCVGCEVYVRIARLRGAW